MRVEQAKRGCWGWGLEDGGWRLEVGGLRRLPERRVLGPFFLACLFAVLLLFQVFGAGISLPQHAMCVRSVRVCVCVCVCLCISVCVCVPLKFTFSFASSHDFWPFTIIFCFFTLACGNLQWKLRIKLIFSLFDV